MPAIQDDQQTSHAVEHHRHHHHHGLTLIPTPSRNPKDPLRWPLWLKHVALLATALTNFTSNFAGAGLSVATVLLEKEFHKTANQTNSLLTFNFLTLGLGNILWVPLARKFGKRPTLLFAYGALFAILIWTAKADTFDSLLAARCLSGFVSAAGESIVPGLVADAFFLHERATAMSVYTIFITTGSAIGPLIASLIVQYSTGTWRTYVWTCAALAGFNTIFLFLCFPESNFDRSEEQDTIDIEVPVPRDGADKSSSMHIERSPTEERSLDVVPKPWTEIWRTLVTVDSRINFWRSLLRPFILIACPDILLTVFVYGTTLAAQIILIFAFPSLLMAPPYRFSSVGVGLMQVSAIIGFLIGMFLGGYVADAITARVIIRQHGHVEPAQRLLALLPAFWVAPVGCIMIAFACEQHLHWVAVAFGFGMISFGTIFAPNIVVTSTVESHQEFPEEALVVINVCKNLVAFLFAYEAVLWVESQGYLQVYMIMFSLLSLGMLLAGLAYWFRKGISATTAKVSRYM